MENIIPPFERFFRLYNKFIQFNDCDALFNLLNSIHSLGDKVKTLLDFDFIKEGDEDFISLKELRNLFHHQSELLNNIKVLPTRKIKFCSSDVLYLCLVPKSSIDLTIAGISKKYKQRNSEIIQRTFHQYGSVVNIYPSIFNFGVTVFELTQKYNLKIYTEEYKLFQESYEFEEENGYDHRVSGRIQCLPNDVETVQREIERLGTE